LILFVLAAPRARAALLISEALYDATGSDNGAGFVELSGAPGTPLDGVRLEGVNGANGRVYISVPLSGAIPASGVFVVADDAGDGTSTVPGADLIANFDFQNGPDSIVLRDGVGEVLDALGYGEFPAGTFFAGEGRPAPDPAAGASLARGPGLVDRNDNLLDFQVLEVPTPGVVAGLGTAPVPLPASAMLLLSGVLALIPVARRRGG
jgi:hypothetical protein